MVTKVFERLIHHQCLQEHNILSSTQFGFQPGHSTQDILVNLVRALLLDIFNSVNHSIVLQKLNWYGIRGAELEWFTDYLSGRRQRVCIGGVRSEWTDVKGPRGQPVYDPELLYTWFCIFVNKKRNGLYVVQMSVSGENNVK